MGQQSSIKELIETHGSNCMCGALTVLGKHLEGGGEGVGGGGGGEVLASACLGLMGVETEFGWKRFLLVGQWQSEVHGQATPPKSVCYFLSFL